MTAQRKEDIKKVLEGLKSKLYLIPVGNGYKVRVENPGEMVVCYVNYEINTEATTTNLERLAPVITKASDPRYFNRETAKNTEVAWRDAIAIAELGVDIIDVIRALHYSIMIKGC